jgi:NAD(P)-dependent dehydrogenase (short-subunit alcohol dehydrogenase family)
MKEGGYGRIIEMGSVASRLASPLQSGYSASKAGLDRLAMVMAIELAPHNITVNVIGPGPFRTNTARPWTSAAPRRGAR